MRLLRPSTILYMRAELLSYDEAAMAVAARAGKFAARKQLVRRVPLAEVQGRVLAEALLADQDQPPFARSTRDGFACRVSEANAHDSLPIAGSTHAGEPPAGPLPKGAVWEIMTGAPVPEGADAVIMLEHVERDHKAVRMMAPRTLKPGENIVPRGAQARLGAVLLEPGALLGPAQIALAATCGYNDLAVYARPRVAILTTGDELVPVAAKPGPGQIRNSNAPMLAALVAAAGGEPCVLPTAADTADALDAALEKAVDADLLLISGGVSAGKFDLVEPALQKRGAHFHFTGVRMQPGKPLVFGELPREESNKHESTKNLPFFGLPGNPISSAATFLLFGATMLAAVAGAGLRGPRFALARLTADVRGKAGLTRFLPAHWKNNMATSDEPEVTQVPWHGSGDQAAFARANCFLVVPEETASLEAGTLARILLFDGHS